MVSDEEIRQKIHEEKLERIYARTRVNQKKIEAKKKADAEIRVVSNEYIDYLREHNLPITLTDITKSISPPHQKLSQDADFGLEMLEAQYNGIMDGFKIRIGFMIACALLYAIPIEWL
tara:strand:- start:2 stop:355 length:354 start_codon:yes stop_codon:yes gene_type:complete